MSATATIQNLPTELLCAIFENIGAANSNESIHKVLARQPVVFALTLVSRAWYNAALITPCLWTIITTRLADDTVKLFLSRAKSLPVRLFTEALTRNPHHYARFEAIVRSCLSRSSSLSIVTDSASRALRALEEICPRNPDTLDTLNIFVHDAKRQARFDDIPITYPVRRAYLSSTFLACPRFSELTGITELEIGQQSDIQLIQLGPHSLMRCLGSLASVLSTLRLNICGISLERAPIDQIVLPRLQNLYLSGPFAFHLFNLSTNLQCPDLRRYSLSTMRDADVEGWTYPLVSEMQASARLSFQLLQSVFVHVDPATRRFILLALPEPFDWARTPDGSLDSLMQMSCFSIEARIPEGCLAVGYRVLFFESVLSGLIGTPSGVPWDVQNLHLHVESMDETSMVPFTFAVLDLISPHQLSLCCPPASFSGLVIGPQSVSNKSHTFDHVCAFYSEVETAEDIARVERFKLSLSSSPNASLEEREFGQTLATPPSLTNDTGISISMQSPHADHRRILLKPAPEEMSPQPLVEHYDVNSATTRRIRRAVAEMDTRLALWGRRSGEHPPS